MNSSGLLRQIKGYYLLGYTSNTTAQTVVKTCENFINSWTIDNVFAMIDSKHYGVIDITEKTLYICYYKFYNEINRIIEPNFDLTENIVNIIRYIVRRHIKGIDKVILTFDFHYS